MSEHFAQQLAELGEEERSWILRRWKMPGRRYDCSSVRSLKRSESCKRRRRRRRWRLLATPSLRFRRRSLHHSNNLCKGLYGSAFTELSAAELQGYLRLETHKATPAVGEARRMERELARRPGRIEARFYAASSSPSRRCATACSSRRAHAKCFAYPALTPSRNEKKKTHLTQDNKLVLTNLCVDYQAEHVQNNKGRFWQKDY
ncbi:hypothetical protein FN846DRAFT_1025978 [Sphaerosporella brunnea]|uniref:Uncharacterized protein n=1 Tax=Sphaerosporella brunnea TaxID=1250544 RepID=A0A5J5EBN0_9PEZI|nr:hypothetical protein FN846DRAFT_1025978 [Sphaerosporella brunnea]